MPQACSLTAMMQKKAEKEMICSFRVLSQLLQFRRLRNSLPIPSYILSSLTMCAGVKQNKDMTLSRFVKKNAQV